jgi:hypothetical protein
MASARTRRCGKAGVHEAVSGVGASAGCNRGRRMPAGGMLTVGRAPTGDRKEGRAEGLITAIGVS